MMKKLIGIALAFALCASGAAAAAQGEIPDHRGTSMDGIEIGTMSLNSNVKQYYGLFKKAGDQYGVDPNLLAAICMQESSGINYSYHEDGSEYPAWGIMQIEYSLLDTFAEFGMYNEGVRWTKEDRLDPEKAVPFAAWIISKSLLSYDCDYMKMIQAYNFGQTVLDRIIEAKGDDWLSERANAVQYASDWKYATYGDKEYIEHVMRYYHGDIDYIGAKVRFDGALIDFDNQYPIIENGYTYIPVRAVAQTLGAKVYWDQSAQTVIMTMGNRTIVLPVGSDTAYVDNAPVKLETKAKVINNRTMVPLRFAAESLDFEVSWDGDTRTVNVQ